MKGTTWKAIAALTLMIGVAAPAEAQGRGNGNGRGNDRHEVEDRDGVRYQTSGDRVIRTDRKDGRNDSRTVYGRTSSRSDDGRYDRDGRYDDGRYERNERNERGNGPSFCRSGRGHPVFGWEWCEDRGWDRNRNSRYPVRWESRRWEDVIFRRTDRQRLDRRGLEDVLGDVVFGRIDTRRRQLSSSNDYLGRWATSGSGRELWITAGGIPIARLVDRNGDRRVDSVYMAER